MNHCALFSCSDETHSNWISFLELINQYHAMNIFFLTTNINSIIISGVNIKNVWKICFENMMEKAHLEVQDIDGGIIMKWILGRRLWDCVLDSTTSGQAPVVGVCGDGDDFQVPYQQGIS
jgi:hypothetical protein